MFTLDNTSGFTQEQLDIMNDELEVLISDSDIDESDSEYDPHLKNLSEIVFNKYC